MRRDNKVSFGLAMKRPMMAVVVSGCFTWLHSDGSFLTKKEIDHLQVPRPYASPLDGSLVQRNRPNHCCCSVRTLWYDIDEVTLGALAVGRPFGQLLVYGGDGGVVFVGGASGGRGTGGGEGGGSGHGCDGNSGGNRDSIVLLGK
ncbi:Hypothetical predicted protein [Olea europaea subsp. europaea]|uniref:Uncharacterized protein n=1 Tax=Olea europaea subsp. europaea TaxID=158383 RepID=A0A8S0TPH5_OLEEU|nr:Hypothetical predicted protein [Olea europaea subsp. europaea]